MVQNRVLADRLSSAASAGIGRARQAAQSAVGVIGEDEQTQYALQIANKNPQAFIAIMQRLLREDPQTALAILRALLRAVDPAQAEQVIEALSGALGAGWTPEGAPAPVPAGGPGLPPLVGPARGPFSP